MKRKALGSLSGHPLFVGGKYVHGFIGSSKWFCHWSEALKEKDEGQESLGQRRVHGSMEDR